MTSYGLVRSAAISRSKPAKFEYGMLPPRFFAHVRDRILQAHMHRRLNRVSRSDS